MGKKAVFHQSALKVGSTSLFISTHAFFVCVCFSRVFPLSCFSHVYPLPLQRNNTSGRNTHTDIRDCWLVTVIPSRHFWCKWGEIKGYHLSVNALRTISFPALCTTPIFKAGFLSIRLHEYSYFPLVKPWNDLSCILLFWITIWIFPFIHKTTTTACMLVIHWREKQPPIVYHHWGNQKHMNFN